MIGFGNEGKIMGRLRDITRLLRGYLLFAKNSSDIGDCQQQVRRLD